MAQIRAGFRLVAELGDGGSKIEQAPQFRTVG